MRTRLTVSVVLAVLINLVHVVPGLTHSESEWYQQSAFGNVVFTDPDLRVSADGKTLLWHTEASAPLCFSYGNTSSHWPAPGYLMQQVRRVDRAGIGVGTWQNWDPFSAEYTRCSSGRYFSESSRNLSGSNQWWPFWEVRLVHPSDTTLGDSARTYMHARTTAMGKATCAPSDFHLLRSTSNYLVVAWDDCLVEERAFEVQRSTDSGATWTLVSSNPSYKLYFKDEQVTAGQSYAYRVRSLGTSGASPWSYAVSGMTLGDTGTGWHADKNKYGSVSFPNPRLRVSSSGQSLLWTKVAEAPSCSSHEWGGDGYVYMQIRKLDASGNPLGNWLDNDPFSPQYTTATTCNATRGRWSAEVSFPLYGDRANWPYWELRYIPEWQKTFQSPTVYMEARTSTVGTATTSVAPAPEVLDANDPVMDVIERDCSLAPDLMKECVYEIMREYSLVGPIQVEHCHYTTSGAACQRTQFVFSQPATDPPVVDDEDPSQPPQDWPHDWHGTGPEGSPEGAWVNEATNESMHPDFGTHPPPPVGKGDHWDWIDPQGKVWERPRGGSKWYPKDDEWWKFSQYL